VHEPNPATLGEQNSGASHALAPRHPGTVVVTSVPGATPSLPLPSLRRGIVHHHLLTHNGFEAGEAIVFDGSNSRATLNAS
jgi:hypothetical protein